jgi:PAS domain S-box-containing protein
LPQKSRPPDDVNRSGARLRREIPRVLTVWEERARRELPPARQQARPTLVDHLPALLARLADALEDPSPRGALQREQDALAVEHGKERARLPGYSLENVVHEYQLLRQVLFELLEEEQPLGTAARDLVLDALQLGVRNAVREFVRVRDAEAQRHHDALARANADLERRVLERTAELARNEERFRTMVDAVKDYAIFTLDAGGRITTWNAGAQRMKGYGPEEVIGRHFSMLYPEEGRRRDEPMSHLRVAAAEGRFRGEGLRIRKNGDLFMADVSITPLHEGGALTGFTKVVQDLTERNLLMQERDLTRTHLDTLQADAEYRTRFVETLAHDLRSPLSAARNAAHLIARSPGDHDKVRAWGGRIADAVARAERMISDLLDASRLEAGEHLSLTFAPCDLREIAEELCDELSTRHPHRLVLHVEGDTTGLWSRDGLRRVLDNLISNALKYGDPAQPITIRLTRAGERVLLAVHNHGTIIPVEEQQQLFRPFHRTSSAEASGQQGWGLGLSLVKGLVDAHGGVVKVESYPMQGTTFTVDLPVSSSS